jgi:hypothetical protein
LICDIALTSKSDPCRTWTDQDNGKPRPLDRARRGNIGDVGDQIQDHVDPAFATWCDIQMIALRQDVRLENCLGLVAVAEDEHRAAKAGIADDAGVVERDIVSE